MAQHLYICQAHDAHGLKAMIASRRLSCCWRFYQTPYVPCELWMDCISYCRCQLRFIQQLQIDEHIVQEYMCKGQGSSPASLPEHTHLDSLSTSIGSPSHYAPICDGYPYSHTYLPSTSISLRQIATSTFDLELRHVHLNAAQRHTKYVDSPVSCVCGDQQERSTMARRVDVRLA